MLFNRKMNIVKLQISYSRLYGVGSPMTPDLNGNDLQVDSISLEGEKGFARLKGKINNGLADMTLELMPLKDSLNTLESMLIGKYIVSPGFYEIPINGPLAFQ